MKVLIVANVAKEHICKFHIPTIKMLKDMGYEVDVACVLDADIPYCDNRYDMSYKRNTISLATIRGIFQLRRILKNNSYDIIHCHTPTGGTVGRLATGGLKRKSYVIYTAHGFHFYKGAPIINWALFFPIEWLLSFRTDCLITINQEDYNNARKFKFRMSKLEKIPGIGVALDKYQRTQDDSVLRALKEEFGLENEKLIMTYVAELLPNKNQEVLLKMLLLLREKLGYGHLILVGPDNCNGRYESRAKKLGVYEHVTFTGWRDDIKDILSITDVYTASSIREGLGLNIIEAMCCGIPVVASINRGHSDIIEDGVNGYLVHHKDYKQFADKVIQCLDEQNRTSIIENATSAIIHYDSKLVLSRIKNIYEEKMESKTK